MNKIETIVYSLVRKNPALKQFIRNCYQSAFDCLPRKKNQFSGTYCYKEGYFFGFHDVSPWNKNETKLLAIHAPFDLRMPEPNEKAEIGFFDFKEGHIGDFHKIGETSAWNWHKACRLQWLDNSRIIFNNSENGKLISNIIDINTPDKSSTVPYPIDSVFTDNKEHVATSFSYERLERCMPGYGYPYKDYDAHIDEDAPEESGLFLIDLKNGNRNLIVSLKTLAESLGQSVNDDMIHFVTHTEFSNDGRYISFLYRRIPRKGNYMKRWTNIVVYDRHTQKLIKLQTQESGSHYIWNSMNQIIASCYIDGANCHALLDIDENAVPHIFGTKTLTQDGHQSLLDDKRFITDTYPDRRRIAHLIEVNTDNNSTKTIADIYSPKKFQTKDFTCHIACDLHPRVSPSKRFLCFDSPTTGVRSLWVIALEK